MGCALPAAVVYSIQERHFNDLEARGAVPVLKSRASFGTCWKTMPDKAEPKSKLPDLREVERAEPVELREHAPADPVPPSPPSSQSGLDTLSVSQTFNVGAFRTEMEIAAGTIIGGNYKVLRLLGKGGMGQVYLAEQLNLGKNCAIKVIPPNQVTEKAWQRFQTEARAVAKLEHPNLVRVTDLGVHEGTMPFYAMEYVEGQSLDWYLKNNSVMTCQAVLAIFLQVAEGLDYAHKNGIVHRDLKPANIVLVSRAAGLVQAKILDFGLAKLTQNDASDLRLTATGEIFGSPLYMSPEQCLGESVDHRSDIYSLGCALFECLTGQPPYTGEFGLAVMSKHQLAPVPSLSGILGKENVPAGLEKVLTKMLAKSPQERYQSALELSEDLRRVAAGLPVTGGAKGGVSNGKSIAGGRSGADLMGRLSESVRSRPKTSAALALLLCGGIYYICSSGMLNFLSPANTASGATGSGPLAFIDIGPLFPPLVKPTAAELYLRIDETFRKESDAYRDYIDGNVVEKVRRRCREAREDCEARLETMGTEAVSASIVEIERAGRGAAIAYRMLARLDARVVPYLIKHAGNSDSRQLLMGPVLYAIGQPAADGLVNRMLQHKEERPTAAALLASMYRKEQRYRFSVGDSLPRQLSPFAINKLLEILRGDKNPQVRSHILAALAANSYSDASAIDIYKDLLLDKSAPEVQKVAALAMGSVLEASSMEGAEKPTGYLARALSESTDWEVRLACANALSKGRMSPTSKAIPVLEKALHDPVEKVRLGALQALMAHADTCPQLIKYVGLGLKESDYSTSGNAVNIAAALGPRAKELAPTVAELARRKVGGAANALFKIGAQYAPDGMSVLTGALDSSESKNLWLNRGPALDNLETMDKSTAMQALPTLHRVLEQCNTSDRERCQKLINYLESP